MKFFLTEEFPIVLVKDVNFFVSLSYNGSTYSAIANFIKSQEWDKLKSNIEECQTDFREYLYVVRFTNQDNQNCVATICDSDEMWQNPQIIEVFILS